MGGGSVSAGNKFPQVFSRLRLGECCSSTRFYALLSIVCTLWHRGICTRWFVVHLSAFFLFCLFNVDCWGNGSISIRKQSVLKGSSIDVIEFQFINNIAFYLFQSVLSFCFSNYCSIGFEYL